MSEQILNITAKDIEITARGYPINDILQLLDNLRTAEGTSLGLHPEDNREPRSESAQVDLPTQGQDGSKPSPSLEIVATPENLPYHQSRQTNQSDRQARGSRIACHRLTEEDIPVVRALIAAGRTDKKIADKYKVCSETIRRVRLGKTWKHVPVSSDGQATS